MSVSTSSTVIHVDDDADFGALALTVLERMAPDLNVVTTTDPEVALALVGSTSVDCIVSDFVSLADGTPFVVAAREGDQQVPILLFTGHEWSAIRADVEPADVSGCVGKGGHAAFGVLVDAIHEATSDGVATAASHPSTESDGVDATMTLETDWLSVERVDLSAGLTELLVAMVTALESVTADPESLAPLGETVDVEAVYDLVSSAAERGTPLAVQVTHGAYELYVDADGLVTVGSAAA